MGRRKLLARLSPLLVLAAAGAVAWVMTVTAPQPRLGNPTPSSPVVMAEPVHEGEADIVVRVLGTVKPVQEVQVRPRVTGTVMELNEDIQPGGFVHAGEVLLRLDPTDYELEVRRKRSAFDRAKADLDLEMGQQNVARAELEQLQRNLPGLKPLPASQNTALALRQPHLAQARAALAAAQADLDSAAVNLERTVVRAPFNALVTARSVSLGSQASTSDVLATLVNTDEYWVEASVPLDRLYAVRSASGSVISATVRMSSGAEREGRVQRITGTLDTVSRMGQVLITVPDPLALRSESPDTVPLTLGDQVQVAIRLGKREGVIVLPRAALRSGDRIWVADRGTLDIRTVDILWRDTDVVYVRSGLADGELVITSDLAAPIQGMSIRLPGASRNGLADERTPDNEPARPEETS